MIKSNRVFTSTFSLQTIFFILTAVIVCSCTNTKKATYFNNIGNTSIKSLGPALQPVIQKSDLLSISVSSLNADATTIFNTPNIPPVQSTTASGNSTQMTGYLVNQDGKIQFPILGNITAAGLTKEQLSDTITKMLIAKKLLIGPIVNIRFLNFRVTVLGEVNRPMVVSVPNEKISILEALGLAGDLTIYAKRDNILLIREEEGEKIIRRINLNNSEIFTSPYYYLKSNDIVYAEPNKERVASTSNARQIIPIILSGLSFFAIIIDRVAFR